MTTLTGLSDQPKQQSNFVLPDGSSVSFYMEYRQQQKGWFADIVWQGVTINGLRLTTSPNFLRQWQHLLPFGLALFTAGNVEPILLADFVNGVATIVVLTADDVATINATSFPGN